MVTHLRDGIPSSGTSISRRREPMYAKCKVWQAPVSIWDEGVRNFPVEKFLEMLVDEKLDKSWPCAPPAQKVSCILGCIEKNISNRLWEVILSPPRRSPLHLEHDIQLCSLQLRKDIDQLWSKARGGLQK